MQQHNFLQGSPEWHAHRAQSKNASDAPAMLGCSPYTTRQQLLHSLHTGLRPEASADQERIYAAGHAIEAAQRLGAEEFIGEELFPVVGSQEIEGVLLSASFDGITMTEETIYECKSLNADLRAAFADMETIAPAHRERSAGKCLAKHYRVQMEQQLAVSGAQRVLFVAANRDGSDVRRCWYYPDPQLRAEIIAGWKQLEADLASYMPPSAAAVEKIVAEPVEALPAPVVQVSGQLTLTDNFKVFEQRLREFLDTELIRKPKTDEDFVNLDAQIKEMKRAREALKSAEAQMLAQVQPVDQAKKTKDMLDSLLQKNVSLAEALLKEEKERRRGEIVAGGVRALADHIAALNKRLRERYMPQVPADFAGVVKGLKSLASMEDKVSTELARAKIAANEVADRIQVNMQALVAAGDTAHFPDAATLVLKAPDDLRAIIAARMAEVQRKLEAERARIRAEEEARAQAKARAEQHEREAAERQQREAAEQREKNERYLAGAEERERQRQADIAGAVLTARQEREDAPAAGPAVIPMPTRAPAAPAGPPTLQLGAIGKRLGFTVTAEFLAELGFAVVKTDRGAKLYREESFPRICDAICTHVAQVRDEQLQAA